MKNVVLKWLLQFFWEEASLQKIFSLFQLDLEILFDINMELAVKLNQSFDTLYELDFLEYSMLVASIKRKIIKKNEENAKATDTIHFDNSKPTKLGIPDNLKQGR